VPGYEFEVVHLAVSLQDLGETGQVARVIVVLRGHVGNALHQIFGGLITKHPGEGGVHSGKPVPVGKLEKTNHGIFDDSPKFPLAFQEHIPLPLDDAIGPPKQDKVDDDQHAHQDCGQNGEGCDEPAVSGFDGGNVLEQEQPAHLFAGGVFQGQNVPMPPGSIQRKIFDGLVATFQGNHGDKGPKVLWEIIQDSAHKDFLAELIPARLSPKHSHSVFPQLPVQHILVKRDGHIDLQSSGEDRQKPIYFLSQFKISYNGSVRVFDGPHHAQGQSAKGPHFDTPEHILSPAGLLQGEPID